MWKKAGLFILLFILIFCYSYFFVPFISDEIWNYGFSYNISKGLVIYRDFNVLQMPLLFFLGSLFIHIFGHHLWSVYILNSIILMFMFIILYKDIGKKSLIIIPIILLYGFYSYSLLCVLFMVIILYVSDKDLKYKDIYIALLVSLVFLTKQHIGICLFVPMIVYSKNRFKSFATFLVPILILCIYLLYHHVLYQFIDCCFLGMLEFGSHNGNYSFLTILWLDCVIYFLYQLFYSHFKDINAFYILAFHIMAVPIFDWYHVMLCFIFVIYYLLTKYKIKTYCYKYFIIISFSFFFFMFIESDSVKNFSLCSDSNSFMYGRNISNYFIKRTGDVYDFVRDNIFEYGDHIFIFSNHAYLIKLELGITINHYDLILDGNMGYHGDIKRIKQLDNICSYDKCLFILDKDIAGIQINKNIRNYVIDNYNHVKDLSYYEIYSNENGDNDV